MRIGPRSKKDCPFRAKYFKVIDFNLKSDLSHIKHLRGLLVAHGCEF